MKSFQNFTAAVISAASFFAAASAHATPGNITALSATTLERSGYLEISGTNFGSDGSVLIGGLAAPVADWQSTKIVAYVPEAAQLASVPVQVVNTLGETSNSLTLTVTERQADGRVNWRFRQDGPYDAQEPVEYQELVFGVNGSTPQLYYYANSHLKALHLDGGTVWTLNSDFGQPAVSPLDGSIHAPFGAYSPNGTLMWIFSSPYPYNTSSPPDIGSDGTHYFVQNTIQLFGLTPTGTQKWQVTMRDSGDNAIV